MCVGVWDYLRDFTSSSIMFDYSCLAVCVCLFVWRSGVSSGPPKPINKHPDCWTQPAEGAAHCDLILWFAVFSLITWVYTMYWQLIESRSEIWTSRLCSGVMLHSTVLGTKKEKTSDVEKCNKTDIQVGTPSPKQATCFTVSVFVVKRVVTTTL